MYMNTICTIDYCSAIGKLLVTLLFLGFFCFCFDRISDKSTQLIEYFPVFSNLVTPPVPHQAELSFIGCLCFDTRMNGNVAIYPSAYPSVYPTMNPTNIPTSETDASFYIVIGTICFMCCGVAIGLCGCIDAKFCRRNETFSIGAIVSATNYTVDIISGLLYVYTTLKYTEL